MWHSLRRDYMQIEYVFTWRSGDSASRKYAKVNWLLNLSRRDINFIHAEILRSRPYIRTPRTIHVHRCVPIIIRRDIRV